MMKNNFDEKLVVCLSSVPLTGDQLSVLSKGLSFRPTPGKPDRRQLKKDMDRFYRDLSKKDFCKNFNIQSRGTTLCSKGSESESDGKVYESEQPPFNTVSLNPNQTWNPVGPTVVVAYIFFSTGRSCVNKNLFAPQ